MPKKVYYRATGVMTLEWVDSPDEATEDVKEAAEATQKHLKDTQHIDTELEEIPPKSHHLPSTWVVCREIPLPGRSIWGPHPPVAPTARRKPVRDGRGKSGSKNSGGSSSTGRKRNKKRPWGK